MKQPSEPVVNTPSTIITRQQRIAEIREHLALGTYTISSETLATTILDEMLERGSARHRAA